MLDPSFVPLGVELLGKYDIGDIHEDHRVLQYQYGTRAFVTGPESHLWRNVLDNSQTTLTEILQAGEIVTSYVEKEWLKTVDLFGFKGTLRGYPALFLNSGERQSLLANPLDQERWCDAEMFVSYVETPEHKWYCIVESKAQYIHCGELCAGL